MDYLKKSLQIAKKLYIGITNPSPDLIIKDETDGHRHTGESNPYSFLERYFMIRNSILNDKEICERYKDIVIIPCPINNPVLFDNYVPVGVVQIMRLFGEWDYKKEQIFKDKGYKVEVLDGSRITSGQHVRKILENYKNGLIHEIPEEEIPYGTREVVEYKIKNNTEYRYENSGMIHGRFQPFRHAHLNTITEALMHSEILYIGITNPDQQLTSEVNSNKYRHLPEYNKLNYWERIEAITEGILDDDKIKHKYNNIIITPFPITMDKYWENYIPKPPCAQYLIVNNEWDHEKINIFQEKGYKVIEIDKDKNQNQDVYIEKKYKSTANSAFISNCQNRKVVYGRDTDIQKIKKLMSDNKKIIAVSGPGGVGKSMFASLVAGDIYRENNENKLFIWINYRKYYDGRNLSFENVLNDILITIGKTVGNESIEVKKNYVKKSFDNFIDVFVVLDNYETVIGNDEEENMVMFLKEIYIDYETKKNVSIIREQSALWRRSEFQDLILYYDLTKINKEDGIKMLMDNIRRKNGPKISEDQCKAVYELLHGFPKYLQLAIDQLSSPIDFNEWMEMTKKAGSKTDSFYTDFFRWSWERLKDDEKKIMFAITYFSDGANSEQLAKVLRIDEREIKKTIMNMSDSCLENQSHSYKIHPMTYEYCWSKLNSGKYKKSKDQIEDGYIKYYLAQMESTTQTGIVSELKNIENAIKICVERNEWDSVIHFWKNTMNHLLYFGWKDRLNIVDHALIALKKSNEIELLVQCLVKDKAWIELRLEHEDAAKNAIDESIRYISDNNLSEDILSLAYRHKGKLFLLKGLDECYIPKKDSYKECFDASEKYYKMSLDLQKDEKNACTQRANLYLDYGRLYWLFGEGYANDYEMGDALEKYKESNSYNEKAEIIFKDCIDIKNKDIGIAKTYGNKGNTFKAMALLCKDNIEQYNDYIKKAVFYYKESLKLAESTKREDEKAHALWGLADIEYWNEKINSKGGSLRNACEMIRESNRIYNNLGGTRDQNATKKLMDIIKKCECNISSKIVEMDKEKIKCTLQKNRLMDRTSTIDVLQYFSGVAGISRVYLVKIDHARSENYIIAKIDDASRADKEKKVWKEINSRNTSIPKQILQPKNRFIEKDEVIIYEAAQEFSRTGRIWDIATLIKNQMQTNQQNCIDAIYKTSKILDVLYKNSNIKNSISNWSTIYPKLEEKMPALLAILRDKIKDTNWVYDNKIMIFDNEYYNPFVNAERRLENSVGRVSKTRIHGDLNLSNILISLDSKNAPDDIFIIDMAESKEYMPIFIDYARMEVEIWNEIFSYYIEQNNYSIEKACDLYAKMREMLDGIVEEIGESSKALSTIHKIIKELRRRVKEINASNIDNYLLEDYYHALYFTHLYCLTYPSVNKNQNKVFLAIIGASLAEQKIREFDKGII
jgi:nicotinamide mononucleotide adenylyltransferase